MMPLAIPCPSTLYNVEGLIQDKQFPDYLSSLTNASEDFTYIDDLSDSTAEGEGRGGTKISKSDVDANKIMDSTFRAEILHDFAWMKFSQEEAKPWYSSDEHSSGAKATNPIAELDRTGGYTAGKLSSTPGANRKSLTKGTMHIDGDKPSGTAGGGFSAGIGEKHARSSHCEDFGGRYAAVKEGMEKTGTTLISTTGGNICSAEGLGKSGTSLINTTERTMCSSDNKRSRASKGV